MTLVSVMNPGMLLVCFAVLRTVLSQESDQVDYFKDTNHVFKTIFFKYNERIRPYQTDEPSVIVNVDMSLVAVRDVDKEKNEIETVFDVHVSWRDGRLYWYSDIRYVTVNSSIVWTPDIEFLNTVKAAEVVITPRFLLVDSYGNVFWSRRFLLRTSCVMNKTANVHDCPIKIGAFQLPKEEQTFKTVNCSMNEQFSSGIVNITEMYMYKTDIPLNSQVFKDANTTEAHCMLSFKQEVVETKEHGTMEKLVKDNGQINVVANTALIVSAFMLVATSMSL